MSRTTHTRPARQAFTIIELLVVIAIIMILAALVAPFVSLAVKQARGVQCVSNLRQIGAAMMSYLKDNAMRFPIYQRDSQASPSDRRDWTSVALPYTPDRQIFLCPARLPVYESNPDRGIQFPINYGISDGVYGKRYTRIDKPAAIGVVADANHDRFYTDEGQWGMPQIRGSEALGAPDQRVHSGHTAGLLFADWHSGLVKDVSVEMFLK